jgi:hypothetical protein
MFDFKERFKSSETIVLLRMLETPEKFQPEAIAAAKEIIESRKENDIKAFEESAALVYKEKEVHLPAQQTDEATMDIWEDDEIEKSKKRFTSNRIIAICVAFIGVNILFLYPKINMITEMLNDSGFLGSLKSLSIMLSPLLFSTAGIIFFYKREKTGWILLVFDFTYRLVFCIGLLIISFRFFLSTRTIDNLPFSFYNIILPLILYGIMLYQMGSSRIMTIYKATNKTLFNTMACSIIAAAIYIFLANQNI